MLVSPKKDCPHIQKNFLLPLEKFEKIDFNSLQCEECKEKHELWLCISCGKAFCGRYVLNHYFEKHYIKNKEHCLCISLLDLSVWCYECMTPGFNDPGSYIESELSSKYLKIISDWKFGDDFTPKKDINSTLKLSNEECTKIKYSNFIELLKNNKFKNVTFLYGDGIHTKNSLFSKIDEKYGIDNFFSKEFFIKSPELFYKFLKEYKNFPTNKIFYYFMRHFLENGLCNLVYTKNFDNAEKKSDMLLKNIVYFNCDLSEGHCISCNNKINIEVINDGIEKEKVILCPKCNSPCKPKIFLKGEEQFDNKDFYIKSDEILYCDLVFIVDTEINDEPFDNMVKNINKENAWIIFINEKEINVKDFKFNELTNKELFIKGKIDEIFGNIIKECRWENEFINKYKISI